MLASLANARGISSPVLVETIQQTPYTYSSVYDGSITGADGTGVGMRDGQYIGNNSNFASGSGINMYLRNDLGSAKLITKVIIGASWAATTGGFGANYTNGCAIQTSNDASTWTTQQTTSGFTGDGVFLTFNINVTARYIQLTRIASGYVACSDFQIYAMQ